MTMSRVDLGDLRIDGRSRAGDQTWLRVTPPGIALDVGRGSSRLTGIHDLFVTHGHLDHSLGIPFVLSNRTLHQEARSRVFCPATIADPLDRLIRAAEALESTRYRYEIVPLVAGDRVEVGKGFAVEAFPVDHVIPSLGFHLIRRKRRLASRLRGLPGEEIARLRREGEEVDEVVEELALSYPGDTGEGVFDLEPRLYRTRHLLLECTFLTPDHRERSRRYGHLHFRDLVRRASRFENRSLVLIHLSRRHRWEELRRRIREELPGLAPRVLLFGGDGAAR